MEFSVQGGTKEEKIEADLDGLQVEGGSGVKEGIKSGKNKENSDFILVAVENDVKEGLQEGIAKEEWDEWVGKREQYDTAPDGEQATPSARANTANPKQTYDLNEQNILNYAVDEWYSKMVVLGCVCDSDVLEAAKQLAQNFNIGFPPDAEWLERFKIRNSLGKGREMSNLEVFLKLGISASSGNQHRKHSSMQPLHKDPGKKRSQSFPKLQAKKRTMPLLRISYDLDTAVHKWYVEQSSSRSVTPGDLEKKAKEVAELLALDDFSVSKNWTEKFINRHGLFCKVNGNCELFLKPDFGFLKCKFESEFEIWYHQWPLTLEECLSNDAFPESLVNSSMSVRFKKYKAVVLNWYLQESKTKKVSEYDMESVSKTILTQEIPGITLEDLYSWIEQWCLKCDAAIRRIRSIDGAVRTWYCENRTVCSVKRGKLGFRAALAAKRMGFSNFRVSETWLTRFVERHRFELSEKTLKFSSCTDLRDVRRFEVPTLVQESFNSATSSTKSSVGVEKHDGSLTTPSKSNSTPPSDGKINKSTGGLSISLTSETPYVYRDLRLEAEITTWYREENTVSPGQYLIKAVELCHRLNITNYYGLTFGSAARKHSIMRLVETHGLHLNVNGVTTLFLKAECGILKSQFELAFEVWFHAYPLDLEKLKVEGHELSESDVRFVEQYLAILGDWYLMRMKTGNILAREIKAKEVEIAQNLGSPRFGPNLPLWVERWHLKCTTWIKKIHSLNSALGIWYRQRRYSVKPDGLREMARETAARLKIDDFSITDAWFRRFVQLHGLYFMDHGKRIGFQGSDSSPTNLCLLAFNHVYNQWLSTDRVLAREKEPNTAKVGTSSIPPFHMSPSPSPAEALKLFDNTVIAWYTDAISNGPVTSGELRQKSEEIACSVGLLDFTATELWMKSFVANQGVSVIAHDGLLKLVTYDPSSVKSRNRFQAIFQTWYYQELL